MVGCQQTLRVPWGRIGWQPRLKPAKPLGRRAAGRGVCPEAPGVSIAQAAGGAAPSVRDGGYDEGTIRDPGSGGGPRLGRPDAAIPTPTHYHHQKKLTYRHINLAFRYTHARSVYTQIHAHTHTQHIYTRAHAHNTTVDKPKFQPSSKIGEHEQVTYHRELILSKARLGGLSLFLPAFIAHSRNLDAQGVAHYSDRG